jgi:hypothetical protein
VRDGDGAAGAICSLKMGMTLPAEPSTLPKRTATNGCGSLRESRSWMYSSATRLVAPITEVGFTALSVEIITKRSTL